MSDTLKKRGRNYVAIGVCLIAGAALLYWRYSTVTVPGAAGIDEAAVITRIGWLTGIIGVAGVISIVAGVMSLRNRD